MGFRALEIQEDSVSFVQDLWHVMVAAEKTCLEHIDVAVVHTMDFKTDLWKVQKISSVWVRRCIALDYVKVESVYTQCITVNGILVEGGPCSIALFTRFPDLWKSGGICLLKG